MFTLSVYATTTGKFKGTGWETVATSH